MTDKLNVSRLREPLTQDAIVATAFEIRQTLYLEPVITFMGEQRPARRRRAARLLHEICRGNWESEFEFSGPAERNGNLGVTGIDASAIGMTRLKSVHLNVSRAGLVADVRICVPLGELVVAGVWWMDDLDPQTDPDGAPDLGSSGDDDHGVVVVMKRASSGTGLPSERSGVAAVSGDDVVWLDAVPGYGMAGDLVMTQRHLLWSDARNLASSIPTALLWALAGAAAFGYSWTALLCFFFP